MCVLTSQVRVPVSGTNVHVLCVHTWSKNKVRELIAVKVLHTPLLNTTVVAFEVLHLGSYASMPGLVHPLKQFWNWFCGMAFVAAVVLLLMSSMSSKCLPFNISLSSGTEKSHWGLEPVNRQGVPTQLFVQQLKTPSQTVPCEQVHCRDVRSLSCWQKVRVVSVQNCFEGQTRRWHRCIASQGEYFDGDHGGIQQ